MLFTQCIGAPLHKRHQLHRPGAARCGSSSMTRSHYNSKWAHRLPGMTTLEVTGKAQTPQVPGTASNAASAHQISFGFQRSHWVRLYPVHFISCLASYALHSSLVSTMLISDSAKGPWKENTDSEGTEHRIDGLDWQWCKGVCWCRGTPCAAINWSLRCAIVTCSVSS